MLQAVLVSAAQANLALQEKDEVGKDTFGTYSDNEPNIATLFRLTTMKLR